MEVQTVKYDLHGKDYYFRLTNRAKIRFHDLAGYDIPPEADMTFQDILMIVYVGTLAGMMEKGLQFEMSWNQWLDHTDCDEDFMVKLFSTVNPEKKKKARSRNRQTP